MLDANLLILWVVGSVAPTYIARHKRLRTYTAQDFTTLTGILSAASRIIVTPNVVTEASNLAGQTAEPARTRILARLRSLLAAGEELYVRSSIAAEHRAYLRLGITDAAILSALDADSTLLTSDLDLYLEAARQGRQAVNFNYHLAANQ